MQIYINKNGQQLGPFEESQISEMLRNGQLSPDDFGFKQGQQEWQKLSALFPTQPVLSPPGFPAAPPIQPTSAIPVLPIQPVSPIQPASPIQPSAPAKSGSSKGLMFGLLGCGGLLLVGVIGVAGFFIWRNMTPKETVSTSNSNSKETTTNTNTNTAPPSNSTPKTPTPVTDYTALKSRAEELAMLAPPQKFETNPVIKGKIAIVEKNMDYDAKVLGIDYQGKELYQLDLDKYGFSIARLATTPNEIDTLIQTSCNKGNKLGTYEGGIPAFANVCKATIIDYKNSAIIAQKTFTNSTPPEEIKTGKSTSEYVLPQPDDLDEYLSNLPLEKLSTPLVEQPFDNQGGTYGKYTGFKYLASELARVVFPESLNPQATIKGKFTVAYKDADGRAELKGFDPFGKEIYKYDYEKWGVGPERVAEKFDEIETLVKVFCQKGSKLGVVKRTSVFANACEVSIIDYKAGTVIAKKSFENKEMRKDVDTSIYTSQYIVLSPFSEIDEFIKGFPK